MKNVYRSVYPPSARRQPGFSLPPASMPPMLDCSAWQYVELSHTPVECYWWQETVFNPLAEKPSHASAEAVQAVYVDQAPEHPPNVFAVLHGRIELVPPYARESRMEQIQRSFDTNGILISEEQWCHIGVITKHSPPLYYQFIIHGRAQIRSWVKKHVLFTPS